MKLESILIDTENKKYEINGQDVSDCASISITFYNGVWNVSTAKKYFSNVPILNNEEVGK